MREAQQTARSLLRLWIFLLRRLWRPACKKIPINGLLAAKTASEFVRYKNAQRYIFIVFYARSATNS